MDAANPEPDERDPSGCSPLQADAQNRRERGTALSTTLSDNPSEVKSTQRGHWSATQPRQKGGRFGKRAPDKAASETPTNVDDTRSTDGEGSRGNAGSQIAESEPQAGLKRGSEHPSAAGDRSRLYSQSVTPEDEQPQETEEILTGMSAVYLEKWPMLMPYLVVVYLTHFPGEDVQGQRVRQTSLSTQIYQTRFGRLVSLGNVWTRVQPLTGVPSAEGLLGESRLRLPLSYSGRLLTDSCRSWI